MNTETTDNRPEHEIAREQLEKLFASLGLTVSISEPFGMAENNWPCIRYTVTINGEAFTYSLGVGHVDWQKPFKLLQRDFSDYQFSFMSYGKRILGRDDAETIRVYCKGKKFIENHSGKIATTAARLAKLQQKKPSPAEVLACVCREGVDADESFANWCANFGSDTDSIKALNTYNECTANGKKARRILSAANFQKFAELSAQL